MTAVYRNPRCPSDPSHGSVFDAPGERFSFYCPHVAHDGFRDRPRTRAFFTTAEIDAGATTAHEARRPAQDARNAPSGTRGHIDVIDTLWPTDLAARSAPLSGEGAGLSEPSVPSATRSRRVPTGARSPRRLRSHQRNGGVNPRD